METDESTPNLDQDNESDDDLLAPTTFLYSKKPFQEIHTPEKIKTPVGNDLSPITPLEKVRQKKAKVKFSFGKLIAEKVAQDEVDKKMARMEEELKGKELIEQGGILDMILKENVKEVNDGSSDDSQDYLDLLPVHRHELDKNVKRMNDGLVNDFMDGYAGEPLFIHEPIPADLTTPVFIQKLIGVDEHFVQQKSPQADVDLLTKEFLLSGFLVDMRLFKKKVEPSVMEWLLSCICHSSDCDVTEGAFNAFWAIVMSKDLDLDWHFSTIKLVKCLVMMGASPIHLVESKIAEIAAPSPDLDFTPGNLRTFEEPLNFLFTFRLQTLLKAYCCYIEQHSGLFSKTDKLLNTLVALRLGIALETSVCSWEIEVFLGCSINLYNEEEWKNEMPLICKYALEITQDHSNKLQMVEMVPVTERGRELKKVLSLVMMSSLSSALKPVITNHGQYLKKAIVSEVLQMLIPIKTNHETDFHQLFSFLSFINHCTPDESISPGDKKNLESIMSILRRLNGDIRDSGGYHLNRTKVKGLILRTVNRLSHIANGLRTQSSLDSYFGEAASSFDQLKFETLQDQPDKMENTSDEESGQSPKPLHPSSQDCQMSSSSGPSSFEPLTDEDDAINENPLVDLNRP
ncbi:SMC5-SMC6 complex localization factor protein 2-like [Rhopilema esculentum]|uniref:SMC5-SMC6 complex localization factor protein 2-like n=1 Tax=Rhopilema esculentum TaxID=499914 RepID=UPI0031E421F4